MNQRGRIHGGDFRRLVRNLRTGEHKTLRIANFMQPKRPDANALNESVRQFNAASPVGSWVEYREVMPSGRGKEFDAGTPPQKHQVRTEAYVHQGHTAAVFLVGKSGFVDVHHCRPIPAPEDAAMEEDEKQVHRSIEKGQSGRL